MPMFLVELHPASLTPPTGDPAEVTVEVFGPNALMRELTELEGLLPGARIRAIALTRYESNLLAHQTWPTPHTKEFAGLPLLEVKLA